MNFKTLAGMYYPADVIRAGDTMVEVGAFDGKRLHDSELFRDGASYHLFEPSPVLFPELEGRFRDAHNVACHQVAIAEQSGRAIFYMREPRGTGNGLFPIAAADEAAIDTLTLGDAFDKYDVGAVRLMMVNCEGAEFDIFVGQSEPLRQVEWVGVSFHTDKHPQCSDGRAYVRDNLGKQFETVAWFREETRCQIWVGHKRKAP